MQPAAFVEGADVAAALRQHSRVGGERFFVLLDCTLLSDRRARAAKSRRGDPLRSRLPHASPMRRAGAMISAPAPDGMPVRRVLAAAARSGRPIAERALPENAHARIPGAVGAMQQPAQIRRERHQHGHRLTHGAGEMGNRSIDGDEQIEHRHHRGGVGEIRELADRAEPRRGRAASPPRVADLFLHADEIEVGHGQQRGKALKRYRAVAVVQLHAAAGPAYADAQAAIVRQAVAPFARGAPGTAAHKECSREWWRARFQMPSAGSAADNTNRSPAAPRRR